MMRSLSYEEFEALYQERIMADFPRMERRPLSAIRRLYGRGRYVCLVLEEEGLAAYATFLCGDAIGSVLLDYFAVDKARRGGGVGGRFFSMLAGYWPGKDGILLECERPGGAPSEAEQTIRRRRIAFYTRGGAEETPLRWRAFGVDYNVLWLPIRAAAAQADLAGDLMALYRLSVPFYMAPFVLRLG